MSQEGRGAGDDTKATVFLLDGTYTVFRSFYAVSPLTAPDGTPTNGVFATFAAFTPQPTRPSRHPHRRSRHHHDIL